MAISLRVLITRAPHQGSELAERLRAAGLEPVLIPAIEIAQPSSFVELDRSVAVLEQFEWIVFTSANAVTVFAEKLSEHKLPAGVRIAAIGPSTARALEAAGLRADLIPPQAVAESLSAALLPYARRTDGAAARFLIVRAQQGRDHLPDVLRHVGAEVTVAPAYRTVVPPESVKAVRDLFSGQAPALAAITFTSSSTVHNLLALCDTAHVQLPAAALRISIGTITSATMRDAGYPPQAEAPQATVAALAETVVQALRART